jgi:peptide/nickel transport system ATP-binding protein
MPSNRDSHSPAALVVEDLRVSFPHAGGSFVAVDGVSFTIGRERVGVVGESGSGKSSIGRAILRLAPGRARISARRLTFGDTDLLGLSDRGMQEMRGRRISMILQDPRYSLHPVTPVGEQIAEAYRAFRPSATREEARDKVLEMLWRVRIADPERVFGAFRHQVSGGMGQRIVMAMMLIQEPQFLIADEPTSALDVVVRQGVLEILDDLVRERGLGLMFISHDLNLVRSFCDRVIVLYRGRIVEELDASRIEEARHPYTQGLLRAMPSAARRGTPLPVIQHSAEWLAS